LKKTKKITYYSLSFSRPSESTSPSFSLPFSRCFLSFWRFAMVDNNTERHLFVQNWI
jgi:hypothetical protein